MLCITHLKCVSAQSSARILLTSTGRKRLVTLSIWTAGNPFLFMKWSFSSENPHFLATVAIWLTHTGSVPWIGVWRFHSCGSRLRGHVLILCSLSVSRRSAPVPATVTLSSPERVWTGCLGFRKHYWWVAGLCLTCARVSTFLLTNVDSAGFGQVMVRSAGIMSFLWVWLSPCWLLSARLSQLPSFVMLPGLSLTSAATRTHHHPWRRCKRWVQGRSSQ